MAAAPSPLDVVEFVIQILDEGSFSSTYKFAVLLALVELCFEGAAGPPDDPTPQALTTTRLAEKVIQLYWPQARPYSGADNRVLRQNSGATDVGTGSIVGLVEASQRRHGLRALADRSLRDQVERVLIRMPLPKLQRIRGERRELLYVIDWDDAARLPSDALLRRYQAGESGLFSNTIQLRPGVKEAFVRLATVLRSFIQQRWVAKVAQLNRSQDTSDQLHAHLFGVDRGSLSLVRPALAELQQGLCFYCGGPLRGTPHVDHFLPWSRFPDDGLANLVLADARCNGAKRDYLAGTSFLERWTRRLLPGGAEHTAITRASGALSWDLGDTRARGAARALYLTLPAGTTLWTPDATEPADRTRLLRALGS